jgi:hypothetical protein
MARREKKLVHHVQMTDGKRAIIQQLLQKYDIETTEDIPDALKDLLGGTIKEMMEAEMDDHFGYAKSDNCTYSYTYFYLRKKKAAEIISYDLQLYQAKLFCFLSVDPGLKQAERLLGIPQHELSGLAIDRDAGWNMHQTGYDLAGHIAAVFRSFHKINPAILHVNGSCIDILGFGYSIYLGTKLTNIFKFHILHYLIQNNLLRCKLCPRCIYEHHL